MHATTFKNKLPASEPLATSAIPPLTHLGSDGLLPQASSLEHDPLKELRDRFSIPVSYIHHPDYDTLSNHAEIIKGPDFDDTPDTTGPGKRRKSTTSQTSDFPTSELWAWLPQTPLLTSAQEFGLFLRYNFLKFSQSNLQKESNNQSPSLIPEKTLRAFDELSQRAHADRNHLLEANTRLIVSVAKKFVSPEIPLDELISEGTFSIVKAIDKFDCSRGFKFSTYATLALNRHFIRYVGQQRTISARYQSSELVDGDTVPDSATPIEIEHNAEALQALMLGVLRVHLNPREQQIVIGRFGLLGHEQETLKAVGDQIGLTRERVRQLERRALGKLKEPLGEEAHVEDLISEDLSQIRICNQHLQKERDFSGFCAKIILAISRKQDEQMTLSQLIDWADLQPNNNQCVESLWKALTHLVAIGALSKETTSDGAAYLLSASSKRLVTMLREESYQNSVDATVKYLKVRAESHSKKNPT